MAKERKELKVGDIRYLSGFSTKVKLLSRFNYKYIWCEVLEVSPFSKHKIGDVIYVYRNILWKKNLRGNKID